MPRDKNKVCVCFKKRRRRGAQRAVSYARTPQPHTHTPTRAASADAEAAGEPDVRPNFATAHFRRLPAFKSHTPPSHTPQHVCLDLHKHT